MMTNNNHFVNIRRLAGVMTPASWLGKEAELYTDEQLRAGMVCSLNAAGKMIIGCPAGAEGNRPMAMIAMDNYDDFTVQKDSKGPGVNMSGGNVSALVCVGGFEVETTEFVAKAGLADVAYSINDLLTVENDDTSDDFGKIKKAEVDVGNATAPIIGVVSAIGPVDYVYTDLGKKVVRFWTVWFPCVEAP